MTEEDDDEAAGPDIVVAGSPGEMFLGIARSLIASGMSVERASSALLMAVCGLIVGQGDAATIARFQEQLPGEIEQFIAKLRADLAEQREQDKGLN